MKLLFGLLLLATCQASRLRCENSSPDYDHRDYYADEDNYSNNLERPCYAKDLKCISNFFAQNTGCSPVHRVSFEDPVLESLEMHVPNANTTITINNALLKGFSGGKIKEFFINKKTDTLILEVVFDTFMVDSLETEVLYYRKGKEPIVASDHSIIDLGGLSLTLMIRKFHNVKAKYHVYAYLPDPNPPLKLGPGLVDQKSMGLLKWVHLLGLSVQEAMVQQTWVYMDLFLKRNICY